jgi:hypothetical protein
VDAEPMIQKDDCTAAMDMSLRTENNCSLFPFNAWIIL